MGLFDRLTGTKRPRRGAVPRSEEDLRAALFGLNRPDLPWAVRDGTPEGVDLVAEWRMTEPAWRTFFVRSRLSRALQIRMRLVTADHEVRALDQQWEVTWVGDTPWLGASREHGRGPARTVSRHWTIGRDTKGGREATETFRFDSAEMKTPLQEVVVQAGWTWRGVVSGTL